MPAHDDLRAEDVIEHFNVGNFCGLISADNLTGATILFKSLGS